MSGTEAPETQSRTGRLIAEVRTMPLVRQLAPGAGIGWPIPLRHRPGWTGETVVYVRLPLHEFRRDQGRTLLYPPFAVLTLEWSTGQPYEFADLRLSRPWPAVHPPQPAGAFPHEAVRDSLTRYRADRARLYELFDPLMDGLLQHRPLADPVRAEYSRLLRRLIEPGLEPYYRKLAPKYCARFLGPGPC